LLQELLQARKRPPVQLPAGRRSPSFRQLLVQIIILVILIFVNFLKLVLVILLGLLLLPRLGRRGAARGAGGVGCAVGGLRLALFGRGAGRGRPDNKLSILHVSLL
jgi:hypothetical protein